MANTTQTATWTLSVPADEASRNLCAALEAMGATVSPLEGDGVIEARTPLAVFKNRWETQLKINVTSDQDERSLATIAITSRGGATPKNLLDELATQRQVKDIIIDRPKMNTAWQQAREDARAREKARPPRLSKKEKEKAMYEALSPDEKAEYKKRKADEARKAAEKKAAREATVRDLTLGALNPAMVCPHCGARGQVRTRRIKAKKGISGGKATGAVLTAGLSVLATGLSRKETVTKAHCGNCNNDWYF
jgi:hypothetical protein